MPVNDNIEKYRGKLMIPGCFRIVMLDHMFNRELETKFGKDKYKKIPNNNSEYTLVVIQEVRHENLATWFLKCSSSVFIGSSKIAGNRRQQGHQKTTSVRQSQ